MAQMNVLAQQNFTPFNEWHLTISKCRYDATGDTLVVSAVPESASVLVASGNTAPSAAVSSGSSTVTLTGGTTGIDVWVVTRHSGNPAGVNAGGVGE